MPYAAGLASARGLSHRVVQSTTGEMADVEGWVRIAQWFHEQPHQLRGRAAPRFTGRVRRRSRASDFGGDLWFAERPEDVDVAKALCGVCPLREQCLAGALERREPWGVWGGQLLLDGAVIAHKRGRGRPRKQPAAA